MPITPPTTTLQAIQTKVRRLTRTPSTAQLSDDDLNNYINTFVVYDFPEHLRMFNLRTQFTFYTNPFQDVYPTDEISFVGVTTNPLYNFQNIYNTVHPPVYIAGYESLYTQSRQEFYGIYPILNNIANTSITGNGITQTFRGVINAFQANIPNNMVQNITILQNEVLFSSIGVNAVGLSLVDVPITDTATGFTMPIGNLYDPTLGLPTAPITISDFDSGNNINYLTGEYTITFTAPPADNEIIYSQYVAVNCSLPQALLYYNDKFIVRPVPDQPYRVNFEAYIRPSALLEEGTSPELEEWWQYIAYGASLKILQDRMDMDTVAMIMPEFKKQENLCSRKSIVQYTNERVATIYTESNGTNGANGFGWPGGPF
jgi:hypothetical protein